jgi:hypothetical protein
VTYLDEDQDQATARKHVQFRVRWCSSPPLRRNIIAAWAVKKWGGRRGACWANGLTGSVALGWEDGEVAQKDQADMDSFIWEAVERAMTWEGGPGRNYQVDVWQYGWLRSYTPRARPPGWAARGNW